MSFYQHLESSLVCELTSSLTFAPVESAELVHQIILELKLSKPSAARSPRVVRVRARRFETESVDTAVARPDKTRPMAEKLSQDARRRAMSSYGRTFFT
jgi:hypothetical protein